MEKQFRVSADMGDSTLNFWVDVALHDTGIEITLYRNDEDDGLGDDCMASEFNSWERLNLTAPQMVE